LFDHNLQADENKSVLNECLSLLEDQNWLLIFYLFYIKDHTIIYI
jgi:hypothetical protein